jgi:hypothetical protein
MLKTAAAARGPMAKVATSDAIATAAADSSAIAAVATGAAAIAAAVTEGEITAAPDRAMKNAATKSDPAAEAVRHQRRLQRRLPRRQLLKVQRRDRI